VGVAFGANGKFQSPYLLKPYLFRDGGKDFACLPIPATADTCQFRVRLHKDTDWLKITGFRLIAE
jgi:hypothetical protein